MSSDEFQSKVVSATADGASVNFGSVITAERR